MLQIAPAPGKPRQLQFRDHSMVNLIAHADRYVFRIASVYGTEFRASIAELGSREREIARKTFSRAEDAEYWLTCEAFALGALKIDETA